MKDFIKTLYDEKLKYNASFTTMKHNGSSILIVYISCDDFLIISNYNGVVAVGNYRFNWDIQEAFINYEIIKDFYTPRTLEKLILKYEREVMKLSCKINIIN